MKSYKQRYEELKQEVESNTKIDRHTRAYIHIDKGSIGRFFAVIGGIALSIANLLLIVNAWDYLGLGDPSGKYLADYRQLLICYPLIFECIFVSFTAICIVALIEGGFDKVKRYEDVGLINVLIFSLVFCPILGLIISTSVGLIYGIVFGLAMGLLAGLLAGFIFEFC